MEDQLKSFLGKCRVEKGTPFSHTTKSMGSIVDGWCSGSYYIPTEYIEQFMILYCNAVKTKCKLTVTEKPGPFTPLRVDFDFKSDLCEGTTRQYTLSTLKKIVKIYQDEIKKIVHPDAFTENMLWCVILEKPSPRKEEGIVKDGFHLHFPYFICEDWVQDSYLRDRAIKSMIEEKVWAKLKIKTPIEDIIDRVAGKVWMLYGSMNYKNEHSKPYLYNNWSKVPQEDRYGLVLDHNQEKISIKDIFATFMQNSTRKNKIKYYLPIFLSIRGYKQPTQLIDSVCSRKIFQNKKRKINIQRRRREEDILQDIKQIYDGCIMDMLSTERAENYNDWMDVGWTLFNIGEGRDETLEMWKEFSKRSSKYIEGQCENLWGNMKLSEKSIASLFFMAKTDSPNDYKKWKETNIQYFINESLKSSKPNEYDISLVVDKMFKDKFICADAKKGIWYYYGDHRWMIMDNEIELRKKIVNDVLEKYREQLKKYGDALTDIEGRVSISDKDSEDYKRFTLELNNVKDQKKKCMNIIDKIKDYHFQTNIIKTCQMHMHNPNFLIKMDENKNYIGCENGIIDLELGIFRDGRPDDYVTFTTGQYYTEYNEDDDEVKELDEYLLKVYPNKNIREYFLDFIATSLKGNINKRFVIFTGPSDGAKSMTFSLLEEAFGIGKFGYFGKFPREMMVQSTSKNSSSASRPELARVRGKIFMASQELTKEEKFNVGFVKEATGNDSFYVRSHYEQGGEIKPNFTMILACNIPPEMPGHDEAVWSRTRMIDHESKFVKPQDLKKFPVPSTFEEQLRQKRFRADPSFRERIPHLGNVMLWKIFQRFKKCSQTKDLHEPKEVLLSTERYQNENDVYRKFYNDSIEKVEKVDEAKKTILSLAEAYNTFKDWYKEEYPSYRVIIGKSTFKKELNKKMGVVSESHDIYGFNDKKSGWIGYRFIQDSSIDLESSTEE